MVASTDLFQIMTNTIQDKSIQIKYTVESLQSG
jgi:hypothetical protein